MLYQLSYVRASDILAPAATGASPLDVQGFAAPARHL
jgi:hypothetical protein